ncbi:RSP_7527 family protein [Thioclava sp. FR2]
MLETHVNPDYDAIMLRARQLRAEAMRDMVAAIFAFFSRKPAVKAAHA